MFTSGRCSGEVDRHTFGKILVARSYMVWLLEWPRRQCEVSRLGGIRIEIRAYMIDVKEIEVSDVVKGARHSDLHMMG